MLVQVCVHVHMATTVCACGSMCVWLSGCLDVEHFFFFGKAFPCCLGLICAGAILSRSRDCNEQLAAHQALTGTWFPRETAGASVCGCAGGAAQCWGMLEQS